LSNVLCTCHCSGQKKQAKDEEEVETSFQRLFLQKAEFEIIIIYNYQCHKFMTCSSINALDSSAFATKGRGTAHTNTDETLDNSCCGSRSVVVTLVALLVAVRTLKSFSPLAFFRNRS